MCSGAHNTKWHMNSAQGYALFSELFARYLKYLPFQYLTKRLELTHRLNEHLQFKPDF